MSESGGAASGLKKYTKNPIFVVGGIVALAVVVYEYRKQKNAATASAALAATQTTGGTTADLSGTDPNSLYDSGYTDALSSGQAIGSPYGGFSGSSFPVSSTYGAATNNPQWGQEAEQALISLGFSGTLAASAIGKYLLGEGGALSPDEYNAVSAAIGQIGPTPTPVAAPQLSTSTGQGSGGTFTPGDMNLVRNKDTSAIWQVQADGTRTYLSPAAYASLGRPTVPDNNQYSDPNESYPGQIKAPPVVLAQHTAN